MSLVNLDRQPADHRLDEAYARVLKLHINEAPLLHQKIFRGEREVSLSEQEALKTYGPLRLNALHLAVIKGNRFVVKQWIAQHMPLNTKDARGYTALHHAAVRQDIVTISLLRRAGASETLSNERNGTPSDLSAILAPVPRHVRVRVWDETAGKIASMAVEDLFPAYCRFSHQTHMQPSHLVEDWGKKPVAQPLRSRNDFFVTEAEQLLRTPSKVYIRRVAIDDNGEERRAVGMTLYASQSIARGSLICFYGGEYIAPEEVSNIADAEYLFSEGCVNGDRVRSYGAFAADGFPNCEMITLENIQGHPCRTVLVAIDEIKPHTPLCWDYNFHEVKGSVHNELRLKALRDYYQRFPLASFGGFEGLARDVTSADRSTAIEAIGRLAKLRYVFNTPTALWQLIVDEIVTYKDILVLLEQPDLAAFLQGTTLIRTPFLLDFTRVFEQKFSQESNDEKQALRQWLADAFDRGDVREIQTLMMLQSGWTMPSVSLRRVHHMCKTLTVATVVMGLAIAFFYLPAR